MRNSTLNRIQGESRWLLHFISQMNFTKVGPRIQKLQIMKQDHIEFTLEILEPLSLCNFCFLSLAFVIVTSVNLLKQGLCASFGGRWGAQFPSPAWLYLHTGRRVVLGKARESESRQENRTEISLMGIGWGQGGQPGTKRKKPICVFHLGENKNGKFWKFQKKGLSLIFITMWVIWMDFSHFTTTFFYLFIKFCLNSPQLCIPKLVFPGPLSPQKSPYHFFFDLDLVGNNRNPDLLLVVEAMHPLRILTLTFRGKSRLLNLCSPTLGTMTGK